jgi:hypothetical protein
MNLRKWVIIEKPALEISRRKQVIKDVYTPEEYTKIFNHSNIEQEIEFKHHHTYNNSIKIICLETSYGYEFLYIKDNQSNNYLYINYNYFCELNKHVRDNNLYNYNFNEVRTLYELYRTQP